MRTGNNSLVVGNLHFKGDWVKETNLGEMNQIEDISNVSCPQNGVCCLLFNNGSSWYYIFTDNDIVGQLSQEQVYELQKAGYNKICNYLMLR